MAVSAKFTDIALTNISAIVDGVEWSGISCHIDGGAVVIDGDSQIHNAVRTWIEGGGVPDPYETPIVTAAHVKTEAQRRIVGIVRAPDLMSCIVKQLNANMRANELNDIRYSREWTPQEAGEAAALQGLAEVIKGVRAKSNMLEAMNPIPADYAADQYWT